MNNKVDKKPVVRLFESYCEAWGLPVECLSTTEKIMMIRNFYLEQIAVNMAKSAPRIVAVDPTAKLRG